VTPPLVLWTARVAALAWLASWVVRLPGRALTGQRLSLGLATAGCVVYLMHLVAAFSLVHDWSHDRASEQTARETRAVTGIDWGGGVWFNYVFTLLWPVNVVREWWERSTGRRWKRWTVVALEAYLAFIVVNATLVFGSSWWWGVYAAAGVWMAVKWRPAPRLR
jgi:hypothetical protein